MKSEDFSLLALSSALLAGVPHLEPPVALDGMRKVRAELARQHSHETLMIELVFAVKHERLETKDPELSFACYVNRTEKATDLEAFVIVQIQNLIHRACEKAIEDLKEAGEAGEAEIRHVAVENTSPELLEKIRAKFR